ncbi:AAA family ATPase [Clostridium botulinum]
MLYLRFGKSLFISMFQKYYDINKKDKFEGLWKYSAFDRTCRYYIRGFI